MKQTEQERFFTTKQWWIGGTIVAIVMAVFVYLLTIGHRDSPSPVPRWAIILFAFCSMEVGVLTFWLAARNAGHKGVPLR